MGKQRRRTREWTLIHGADILIGFQPQQSAVNKTNPLKGDIMSYEFRKFSVKSAQGCAWRARYVYAFSRVPRFYIGIDPMNYKPNIFGGWFVHRNMQGKFRFRLPTIRWKYPCGRFWLMAYKVNARFWHNMDGRWGWFTPKAK